MAYHKQPAVAAEKVDAAIVFSLEQTRCNELQLKTEQRKALSAVLNESTEVPLRNTQRFRTPDVAI